MAHNILTTLVDEGTFRGLEEVPDMISAWFGQFRETVELKIGISYPKIESGKALVEGLWLWAEEWFSNLMKRFTDWLERLEDDVSNDVRDRLTAGMHI